ncbi:MULTISPECIES: GntR family transcriptional regulator [Microbacterium]|uniref:GntR family transcriptional regulator n=1 Tax=Microbacterium resistens TaxID=156977 RepID=A0ABY3RNS3_9MICO|nr:GntR family transcriptional regulator [Microbacterium resistens]MDA4892238.1 GntR family transcriptional regulator [Streptomyces sp. MS2A]UGS25431.1 GntR family transcriptional regulator [Microbacterium resistens]
MGASEAGTKHERVRRHLEEVIDQGLAPHERLPTERELAEALEVNRQTVRRALDELERDGLVYRLQGAGTFVSATRISKTFELTSFSEDMRMRNMRPGSQSVDIALATAGQTAGYALQLSPGAPVVRIRRIRTADDVPICLEECALAASAVPGLEEGIHGDSLYDDLRSRYGLTAVRADQEIHAIVLDEQQAEALQTPAFSPAFLVKRTTYDARSRPIEYAESVYRGDRYSYQVSIARP